MKTTFATKHLAVRTSIGPDAAIEVRGELDLAGVATFRAAVRELEVSCRRRVVLDLGLLSFIDAAGLHAVLDLHDECREVSTALTILPGPRQVQRVFELTGADEFLPLIRGRNPRPEPQTTNDMRRKNGSQ
jgi:anti-anti-sigma factor